jgi:hypothetical protein
MSRVCKHIHNIMISTSHLWTWIDWRNLKKWNALSSLRSQRAALVMSAYIEHNKPMDMSLQVQLSKAGHAHLTCDNHGGKLILLQTSFEKLVVLQAMSLDLTQASGFFSNTLPPAWLNST